MSAIVVGPGFRIPRWVRDLKSFRRWARSPEFPDQGWFSYLGGELWVEPVMEKSVHNRIKTAIVAILALLADEDRIGLFYSDRMRLTNVEANLSTEPDGMLVLHAAMDAGEVRLVEGDQAAEVLGTPGMVFEVVSTSSVRKDTEILPLLYWQAGVSEYWIVDSRAEMPELQILRRGRSKLAPVRAVDGWVKSDVFGKSIRLVRLPARHGVSDFRLEVR